MSGNASIFVFSATVSRTEPRFRLGPPGDGAGAGFDNFGAFESSAALPKSYFASTGFGSGGAASGVKIGVIAGGGQLEWAIG